MEYTVLAQSGRHSSAPMTLLMSRLSKVLKKRCCSRGLQQGCPSGDGMFHGRHSFLFIWVGGGIQI